MTHPNLLIDEFQDTDRVQYEIFDRLFPRESDPPCALYLIGDPKQSIYRFRGADIDMYLRARDSANQDHSLDKNWRSSARLINALNSMYAQSDSPFGNADIDYQPVTAGGRAEGQALCINGEPVAPLQFDYAEVTEDKLPYNPETESMLASACANRVAWLLNYGSLGDKSIEAKDFLRVLSRPGDTSSLSRVLASPLAGYSTVELLTEREDAVAWQRIEESVEQCREQYQQAGPLAALLRFMALFDTRKKAPGTAAANSRGTARVIGNYLHMADVLQSEWQDHPDLQTLIKTVQQLRELISDEALQLRLESDEALVQIVTVHMSKGLQYPVVMLPFACMGRERRGGADTVEYTEDGAPRLDVGSSEIEERKLEVEQADSDEALRTLYVALTRAEQSCWVGVVANRNAKSAALWKLLNTEFDKGYDTLVTAAPIMRALRKLDNNSDDIAISETLTEDIVYVPANDADTLVAARTAKRNVVASWRVGSYSALARGATFADERPDHDAVDVPTARPETVDHNSPFHFPRGAQAGTLIHSVFEHLDFKNTQHEELHAYAERQLRAHGTDTVWTPALCKLVQNTLDTPLTGINFALNTLDKKDRLDELGFHFPVHSLKANNLVSLLRDANVLSDQDGLQFESLAGYMTGFIDLTFRVDNRWYIADYKSNHLGYQPGEYGSASLDNAMQQHRYDLQYLIYSVALQRYLTSRLPGFDSATDFAHRKSCCRHSINYWRVTA